MNILKVFHTMILYFLLSTFSFGQFAVLLDPGHRNNASDCGASSGCVFGYCEADLVLDFALYGYSEIDYANCDWDPYQTRTEEQTRTLQQRIDMANNSSGFETDAFGNYIPYGGVELFYSIHANSEGNGTATGTEIYYYDYNVGDPNANNDATRSLYSHRTSSMALAAYIYETQSENSLASWRGVKDDTQSDPQAIAVLRQTNMPAVLLETGYISNEQECQNMNTTSYLWTAGYGIKRGICYLTPDSPEGWIDFVINDDWYDSIQLDDGEGMLVENTNSGNSQGYQIFSSTFQFNEGSFAVIEPHTRLEPDEYSTVQNNGGVVFLAPAAEIVANGNVELVSGEIFFTGLGSCIRINENGTLQLSDDQILNVKNEGLIIHDGGLLELMDNAQLIFDSSSTVFKIYSGSVIELGENASIEIHSELDAQGTEQDPIIFTSLPSSGNWEWIKLIGDGDFVIKYASIDHGGIYISNANPVIEHCTISDNSYGIYNTYASPTIHDNNISSCTYGIYNYWSDSDIRNNELNCSSYGIYNYRSSPDIYENEIYGATFGIRCNSYSSPQLTSYSESGFNYVHDNELSGLYAEYSSNPFMGSHYCIMPGNNSFVDNDASQVIAQSNSNVIAEDNWWGSASPHSGWFSGNVDYVPYLTSPPSMPENIQQSPEEEDFDIAFKNNSNSSNDLKSESVMSFYDKDWNLWKKTRFVQVLIYNGEPDSAINICKNIISQNPDSSLAFFALDLVWQASRLINREKGGGLNDFIGYLEFLSNQNTSKPLYGSAELLLAGFEREGGLARIESVFNNYHQTYLAETALFQKFMFYFNESEDSLMARSVVNRMDRMFPESPLTSQAHELFGDPVSGWIEISSSDNPYVLKADDSADKMVPEKYELIGAYPNPFNPSTRIRYAIPRLSKLEVDIYNMLGQKVKDFPIAAQQPGIHDLVWDGTNDARVAVSSGLYVIRLKAISLEDQTEVFGKSIKVTLLK